MTILDGQNELTPQEIKRLLSLLNLTAAHDPRDSDKPCPGCTAREKLKRALGED